MRISAAAVAAAAAASFGRAAAGSASGEQLLLRPESELQSDCFGFPERNFDRLNCVKCQYGKSPHFMLSVGDPAVDFTLHDLDGSPWTLSEHLGGGKEEEGGKPVVLLWGMFTCPAYQGLGVTAPFERCSYWHENALVEEYSDRATFVHLYGPEPHPMAPDTNFDSGVVRPNYWSVTRQVLTYEARLEMAARIRDMTHPQAVLLPDYLSPNPYGGANQPVWCTYAPGARTATVIHPGDGTIWYQSSWLDTDALAASLDEYWATGGVREEPEEGGPARTPRDSERPGRPARAGGRPARDKPGGVAVEEGPGAKAAAAEGSGPGPRGGGAVPGEPALAAAGQT